MILPYFMPDIDPGIFRIFRFGSTKPVSRAINARKAWKMRGKRPRTKAEKARR